MNTIAILIDADCKAPEDAWIALNAAISLTRIALGRDCRLLLQGDSASLFSILHAAAEYHRPAALESEKVYQQTIWMLPPLDSLSSQESVENQLFMNGRNNDKRFDGIVDALAFWSGCVPRVGDGQDLFSRYKARTAFEELRPSVIVQLGDPERLLDTIGDANRYCRKNNVPFYLGDQSSEAERSDSSGSLLIDSVLSPEQRLFSWIDYSKKTDDSESLFRPTEAQQEQISMAQRLARLSISFERIVDKIRD
jgi:hypothetical protein